MLNLLKQEANVAYTENGARALATTGSCCLDLFSSIGGLRQEPETEITRRFQRAFAEDPDLAMKTLFFARDVRGGLGERRVFRVILRWLCRNEPESVRRNLGYIAEFGRFDDVLALFGTPCEQDALDWIRDRLQEDRAAWEAGEPVSLLAKWLPSANASCGETVRQAKKIARYLGMREGEYRRILSALRAQIQILENHLRERDYTFDYAQQPSCAMLKYRKAFLRNDRERYQAFLEQVRSGAASLHTGALTPYQMVAPLLESWREVSEEERLSLDTAWRSLENFAGNRNALVVIDGSASMYGWGKPQPAAVAISLGLYFAERNTGAFRNHFITFSQHPRLVEIQGRDLFERARFCQSYNEVANTNIQRVFELVLQAAVKGHVPQEEMPETLYIISDMEFDSCTKDASLTNFQYAKQLFEENGYHLPQVVFWNVASRSGHQPVSRNEQGVALVSGCTPRLFAMLAEGKLSPEACMREILGSQRYAKIAA